MGKNLQFGYLAKICRLMNTAIGYQAHRRYKDTFKLVIKHGLTIEKIAIRLRELGRLLSIDLCKATYECIFDKVF
jgi:hypothetical protein